MDRTMERVRNVVVAVLAMGVFAFGATEAYAARGELRTRGCGEWNWCAPSEGGQENCNNCCASQLGFCLTEDETPYQGCVCYGG